MALESPIAIPHVGRERDATVLYFTGRHLTLDEPVLTRIRDMLSALAQYQQREKVIIDFNNVDSIFSPALALLVGLHQKLQATGRRLILRNVGREVHEVFVAANVDKVLELRTAGFARGA